MLQNLQTFLTLDQATDAVAADFGQYGPQPDLFCKLGLLVLGNDFKTEIFNDVEWALIRRNDNHPFEPVDDTALGFYLIHMLETAEKDAASMARICELVFQTSVRPGVVEGESGVWVESHMNGFVCKRCGNCCRQLGNECTREDRLLWESLGRSDILSWVKEEQSGNGEIQFRIWIDPQKGKPAESCPFIAPQPGKDTFFCTIQTAKPLVCREYPFTKKHAKHTGCIGFDVIHPDE